MTKIILITITLFANLAFADSPLTSTPFHDAYTDIDIVLKAEQLKTVNQEIADYLSDDSNPVDIKAAVINAIGWENSGNTEKYANIVYGGNIPGPNGLSKGNAFVIGYLMAMENYFTPEKALPYLKVARSFDKRSFTLNIIYNLVRSQIVMAADFCKVWKYNDKVFNKSGIDKDMREAGRKIIYDYIVLYKSECK